MAKANRKTKPRQRTRVDGEDNTDDKFVSPDREDQVGTAEGTVLPVEEVNFREGTSEVIEANPDADDGDDKDLTLRARSDVDRGGDRGGNRDDQRRQERRPPERSTTRGARADRDDDDQEDNRDNLSRDMRKRIARERAITNRERALREQTQRELGEERAARQQIQDRLLSVERAQAQISANGDVKSLEAKIEALRPRIIAATEAGNTVEALRLQEEMSEHKSNLAVLKKDLEYRAANADAQRRQEEQRRQQQQQHGDTSQQLHPAERAENIERGNEWKRRNKHWWRHRENDVMRADSERFDKEILEDIKNGVCEFEPYSEEHFEELSQRMAEEYPDVEFCDLEGQAVNPLDENEDDEEGQDDRRGASTRRGAAVNQRRNNNGRAPTRGTGSVRGNRRVSELDAARAGRVTLDQDDFNTMRIFRMDPSNPEHKKYFAREKARRIIQDAERGRN